MNKFILTLCVFTATLAQAQSSYIEYDFSTETYHFYKIKKNGDTTQLKQPVNYAGVPTKLLVTNINTNYYDVDFSAVSSEEKPINSDQGMTGMIESFTMGTQAFNQLIGEVKGNDIYKSLWVDGEFQGLEGLKGAFGMGQTEFQQKLQILSEKLEMIEQSQIKLQKASANIRVAFEKILLVDYVDDQLVKLQLNRKMSPEEIKERSAILIKKILNDEVSLESVISSSGRTVDLLNTNYASFKSAYSAYVMQKQDAENYIASFMDQADQANFKTILTGFKTELLTESKEIGTNSEALDLLMKEYNSEKIRNSYSRAFEKYDDIQHTNYSVSYTINGDLDVTQVTMNFKEAHPIDSVNEVILKSRQLSIPTSGGLRINSSAGMAFTTFFNGQNSYSSANGMVTREPGDAFVPAITTMFHFYKQTYRPIALGGAFGIAVPVEGDKDFIYMLGASAIVGKTQRVILNFGAFGGKNERLSGYQVGEKIASGAIVPTTKVFDFGAYIGLTLNIGQIF